MGKSHGTTGANGRSRRKRGSQSASWWILEWSLLVKNIYELCDKQDLESRPTTVLHHSIGFHLFQSHLFDCDGLLQVSNIPSTHYPVHKTPIICAKGISV